MRAFDSTCQNSMLGVCHVMFSVKRNNVSLKQCSQQVTEWNGIVAKRDMVLEEDILDESLQ